jgi:hypothetical protein
MLCRQSCYRSLVGILSLALSTARGIVARTCFEDPRLVSDEEGKTADLPNRSALHWRLVGILAVAASMGTASLPAVPSVAPPENSPFPARLSFTKVMKGSEPEYMSFIVEKNGKVIYDGRKLADPPAPHTLQISAATAARLFSLAESLGYFRSLTLESNHKVANMGQKTLTYEADGQASRVEYNYTENRTAQELVEQFEKISMVEQHIPQLEYALQYDRLSVANQLRTIQIELDEKDLVEPELLIPTLEKIAKNPRLLHLAQVRAQDLLKRIQEKH